MSHDELPLDHVNDCDRAPAPLPPHLFTCRGCGRGYSSARALGWRSHAAHPFLGDDHHER